MKLFEGYDFMSECAGGDCSGNVQATVCGVMASSNMRFQERANAAAASAIEGTNQTNLQFAVKGVGNLEKDKNTNNELLSNMLASMFMNNRAGGINAAG